ncbi:MAG: AMP-binding protein, partial [Thermomicrobiales bacterium]
MSGDVRLPDTVRTIPEALGWWAKRTPDAPALETLGAGTVSYAQLWQGVRRLRSQLHALGIGRGARVAVLVADEFSLAVILLAVISAATAVPLDPSLTTLELERLLAQLDVDALLRSERNSGPNRPRAGAIPTVFVRGTDASRIDGLRLDGHLHGRMPDRPAPAAGDIATVYHTSGTTGTPRPAPHTQATLMIWGQASVRDFGLTSR